MFKITLCGILVFIIGVGVAFQNTSSIGFDENIKMIESNEEGIIIMNKEIKYKNIKEAVEKANEYLPDKQLTCHYL